MNLHSKDNQKGRPMSLKTNLLVGILLLFVVVPGQYALAGTTLPLQTCSNTSCNLPVPVTADANTIYYVKAQCSIGGTVSAPKSLTCSSAAIDMKCPNKDVTSDGNYKICQCNAPIRNPGSSYTINAKIGC